LKSPEKAILAFHAGLFALSLPAAAILFLLLRFLGAGSGPAIASVPAVPLFFQVTAFLYRAGLVTGNLALRLSYWTLKILQSLHVVGKYVPESMVIAVNNRKVLSANSRGFVPSDTLILVPHCLQNHQCPVRLTFSPDACRRCGKCPVGGILDLRDKYGTGFAIVSGGTAARMVVEREKPRLIIAVACPVDLSLGIMDVQSITTVGVLNQWRNGPCFDTWVDVGEVEAALSLFLEDVTRED